MYERLPDCARAKIFLFLSTPTADIIRQDIHRQYELYAPILCPASEWRLRYYTAYFMDLRIKKPSRRLDQH